MEGGFVETSGTAYDLASWHTQLTGARIPFQRIEAVPEGIEFCGRFSRHILDRITALVIDIEAPRHVISRTAKHVRARPEPYFMAHFQASGSSILRQSGSEARLTAGDCALTTATAPYSWEFEGTFSILVLHFPQSLLRVPYSELQILLGKTLSASEGLGRYLAPFVTSVVRDPESMRGPAALRLAHTLVDLIATRCLEYIDGECTVVATERDSLFRQIIGYIDDHLSEPGLDAEAIAAAHHVSTRHIQAIVQQRGTTISAWVRACRLDHCRRDLVDPLLRNRSIREIAAHWGILDAAYFSRIFKAEFGESPRQWRARTGRLSSNRSVEDWRPSV